MKSSTDLFFCAFLMHKGHKIEKYDVISRGKVCCYFKLSEDEWQKLKLDFNNSELSELKMNIEKIRDLGY